MSNEPQPGRLLSNEDRQRDAIHIALAPVTAAERLSPGQHVGLVEPDNISMVGVVAQTVGIVDPFLTQDVEAGQKFWLFLYPNTVTGLRHIWTHPAFNAAAAGQRVQSDVNQHLQPERSLRDDFLETLAENEDDVETRLVYSDWLDEQGEHEEAERQRKWPVAKRWLMSLVQQQNDQEEELWESPISYQALLDFGYRAIEQNDFYFSCGNNMTMCDALRAQCDQFWQNWSVLTGVPVPPDAAENTSFSCAC